jgi:hypothetical protein
MMGMVKPETCRVFEITAKIIQLHFVGYIYCIYTNWNTMHGTMNIKKDEYLGMKILFLSFMLYAQTICSGAFRN